MPMISEEELREAIKRGLARAGKTIRDDVRPTLPKRSGRLRRGLKFGVDKGNAIVLRFGWPQSPYYAHFVEFGRRASTKTTRPTRANALRIGNDIRASARGSSLTPRKLLEKGVTSSEAQAAIERELTKSITPLFKDIIFDKTGKARFR